MGEIRKYCAQAASGDALNAVRRAIDDPELFAFSELLAISNVRALGGFERPSAERWWYDIAEIFAYGTYRTYADLLRSSSVPDDPSTRPSDAAVHKLRMLTVLSVGARQRIVPYAAFLPELELEPELQLSTRRELEQVIVSCMYAGLIRGKMDQRNACLALDFVEGRDVRVESVYELIQAVSEWRLRVKSTESRLETHCQELTARQEATAAAAERAKAKMTKKTSEKGSRARDHQELQPRQKQMKDMDVE